MTMYFVDKDGKSKPVSSSTPLPINIKTATGAVVSPWKINWSDIYSTKLIGSHPEVTNEDKFFDNDLSTYGHIRVAEQPLPGGGYARASYQIRLQIPTFIKSVVIFVKNETPGGTLMFVKLYYEDGTSEEKSLDSTTITVEDYSFKVYSVKFTSAKKAAIVAIETPGTGVTYDADIHGIYIYTFTNIVSEDILSRLDTTLLHLQSMDENIDYMQKHLSNIRILTDEDVDITVDVDSYENLEYLTDNNMNTYATFNAIPGNTILIKFNEPIRTSRFYIYQMNALYDGGTIQVSVYYQEEGFPHVSYIDMSSVSGNHLRFVDVDSSKTLNTIILTFIDNQVERFGFIGVENPIYVNVIDADGNITSVATEDTLAAIKTFLENRISSPFKFDSNGNLVVSADLNASDIEIGAVEIKDATTDNRLVIDSDGNASVSINKDNSGLAKDVTLQYILSKLDAQLSTRASESTLSTINTKIDDLAKDASLQSILSKLDTQLSTRASEATLSELNTKLNDMLEDLDPTPDKYIDALTLSGSFVAGTYTATYTPQSGEIVFIDNINLSSLLGEGRLRLYWGTNVIAEADVYYRANMTSSVNVKKKIVGDGSTALTLELYVLTSASYFGKANAWKVVR